MTLEERQKLREKLKSEGYNDIQIEQIIFQMSNQQGQSGTTSTDFDFSAANAQDGLKGTWNYGEPPATDIGTQNTLSNQQQTAQQNQNLVVPNLTSNLNSETTINTDALLSNANEKWKASEAKVSTSVTDPVLGNKINLTPPDKVEVPKEVQDAVDKKKGDIVATESAKQAKLQRAGALAQQGVSMLGNAFDTIGGGSGTQNTAGTQGINQLGEMATKMPGMAGAIATAAVAANKVANNTYNKIDEYQDQSLGTQIFGSNALGIFGVNRAGSKKFGNFSVDPTLRAQIGAGYSGSMKNMDYAANNISGKRVGTFDVNKMQKRWDKAQSQYQTTAGILDRANDILARSSEMSAINSNRRLWELQGGYDLGSVYAAKQGMKLDPKPVQQLEFVYQEAPNDYFEYQEAPEDWIEKAEEGIKFQYKEAPEDYNPEEVEKFAKGGQFNVIPEGALHAHKHNMDTDLDITKKGVPVIDNQGNQQAEIEREEITFRKEVTDLLEELCKQFYASESSDQEKIEAAIEAGKLLVDEILYNTQDRTGLIERI